MQDHVPRAPTNQNVPPKKTKSDTTTSIGGSNSSNPFGKHMSTEFHLKREAAEKAYEASKEKDLTLMRLDEMKFLATSTKDMIPGTDLHQFDVHNDGYFAHLPLNYVDGVILEMAVPRMPYEQLAEFLEEKCGCYFQGLYYQVPSQDLEKGLVRVSDDRSTSYMFDVEETFGRLNLYLDHLDMNLSEYLSQAITYDMDDLVSKKIGPPKKRYCNDFSVDEMVDWAEMEVETEGVEARASTTEGVEARNSTTEGVEARNSTTEGVEARTRTKDKGKEKVSEDASDVVETRRCTVEVDTETEYESDDESDYQSDKSVDYLSPGEDELIELRNRMKANRKEKAKAKDKPDSGMNEPNEENSMPADNVRGETFEEHDIYMNELLKSLKTADKDGITEDPFISVEKHVERYPMYDETTHWRLRKPKYTSVAQFKECLTYYALANGFSLWHERSGEERVVAKCGQRPPKVSAPEKGKQRKQTKYPCASSDALPKCPWRCYARWMTAEKTFQCISLVDEHTCVRNFNFGALVNYKWIAKIFGDKIRANPNIRSYGKAILDSNPGSIIKLAGCRKIIALDGCFLKRPNQGEILTTIGRDGNNHIYPVAWAMVNVENKDNWSWFLELLEEDLGCSRGNGLTLIGRGAGRCSGASGSIGRGAGGSGGASGSRGRGAGGSRGRGVGGLQDEPDQTQDEPQQTQHEPEQTQDEDQMEQTEDQAEIVPTT
ncbi:multidrug resistance-associated protein 5 [Tanacetum coccineum]